jgi:phosphoglycerate dehydrogenase-like enzyme
MSTSTAPPSAEPSTAPRAEQARTITVCLPDADAVDGVAPVPDAVRLVVWDGFGAPPEGVADTEFLLGSYMGEPAPDTALAQLPRLKVIQLLSAGVERWRGRVPDGVTLCNGRGVHGGSTAELAVTGILALLRGLPQFLTQQTQAEWAPATAEDLDGKRLLVIGAGDIGRRAAAALAVFSAVPTFVARTARDDVHGVPDLPQLLPAADIVLIAVPLTDETRRLVDAEFLRALPDHAVVANIARGAIVDTDALLAELQTQRLRAFLDVTDPEPLPPEHPLWHAPGVIITPHVGGGTTGWQRRGYRLVREQLERYVAGRPLANVVAGGY